MSYFVSIHLILSLLGPVSEPEPGDGPLLLSAGAGAAAQTSLSSRGPRNQGGLLSSSHQNIYFLGSFAKSKFQI